MGPAVNKELNGDDWHLNGPWIKFKGPLPIQCGVSQLIVVLRIGPSWSQPRVPLNIFI
jgi:hypothetical protein